MAFPFNHEAEINAIETVEDVQALGLMWLDPQLAQTFTASDTPTGREIEAAVLSCQYTAISALLGPEPVFSQVFREALHAWQQERRAWTWLAGHVLQEMLLAHDPSNVLFDFQGELNGANYLINFQDQGVDKVVPHPTTDLCAVIDELARFLECHQRVVDVASLQWDENTFQQ